MQDLTSPVEGPASPTSPVSPNSPNQARNFVFRSHKRAHSLLSPTTPTLRSPPPQRRRLALASPTKSASSYTHKATQCPSPHFPKIPRTTGFPPLPVPSNTQRSSPARTRQATSPDPGLAVVLNHLRVQLKPLVRVTDGCIPTNFPRTLLQFHLLTHSDLDELARHYHQVWPPLPHTCRYPIMMKTWVWNQDLKPRGRDATVEVVLETKRRRFGRFIGLRGCDSPIRECFADPEEVLATTDVEAEMEIEWSRALERAREEEIRMEKMWRGI